MTLTQAAIITRRGIVIFFLAIFLGVTAKVGFDVWQNYQLSTLPPVEEKAEEKFGTLPSIILPPTLVSSSNYSYSLDTTTGGLPETPKLGKVYFIPRSRITLLAPDKAKELAATLGYLGDPEILSETEYKFNQGKENTLIVDLTSSNFRFQRVNDLSLKTATSSAQAEGIFADKTTLTALFKNYLSSKNLLPIELKNGRSEVIYDKGLPDQSATAVVSLWPEEIDQLPTVTAFFKESIIKTTITKAEDETDQFIAVDYYFWPPDLNTSSTYEIKTADEAFQDLKSGLGFISLEPNSPQVSITSSYLAYYLAQEYTPYLQPVFVFEGPGFAAIVPAIISSPTTP